MLEAFARGAGGQVVRDVGRLVPGRPAVFYGVNDQTIAMQRQCLRDGLDWYYIDNPYFGRHDYFRVCRGRRQHSGIGDVRRRPGEVPVPDIAPWRDGGAEILITTQTPDWYRLVRGMTIEQWLRQVAMAIEILAPGRPHRVRLKPAGTAPGATLMDDMADAWCLVTLSSNSAVEAICAGVPAIVLDRDCAALPMAGDSLEMIRNPPRPRGRHRWAEVLASNQWTEKEMANGRCWADLQAAAEHVDARGAGLRAAAHQGAADALERH